MKNFMKGLCDSFDITNTISFIIAIVIMICITVLGIHNLSIRLAWNDLSRFCDADSMIAKMTKLIDEIVISIETNIFKRIAMREA